MKIFTDGSRFIGGQIDRIDQGFVELGHELTQDIESADIIYSNNPSDSWNNIIKLKQEGKIKGKIIFNVLDCPEHLFPNYDLNQLYQRLKYADKVTCISKYVQTQLFRYFKMNAQVIYNPAKNVYKTLEKKYPYKFLMVGRLLDGNKRANLAISALQLAGVQSNQLAIVGSENPGYFGDYLGIVSDEELNNLYNSVDFVLMTSLIEGLGLPGLEATLCDAIPIICHDLTTFNEFYPPEWGNFPNPYSIAYFIRNLLDNPVELAREKRKSSRIGRTIGPLLHHQNVARRILE